MPISKIKGNAINDDAINSARLADNIEFTGTHIKVPSGTTAERPGSPAVGYVRYNTTTGVLEQYMVDGWQSITVPPIISSLNIDNFDEADDPQTLVITGSNFDSAATAVLLDNGGNTVTPTTSTRDSASQITIVFSGGDVITSDNGPYDIQVTTGTGLVAKTENGLTLDNRPAWTTASGNIGTVYEDVVISTITVVATDPEGESVTYSITSGALPTGLSLSSGGAITGTPNVNDTYNASGITHNFTVTADDGTGNTTPQSFNILRKWKDGTSSALAAVDAATIYDFGVNTYTNGTPEQHWIQTPSGPKNIYCKFYGDGWGWMLSHSFGGTNATTTNDNEVLIKAGFWMTTEQMGNLPSSYSLSGTMSGSVDTHIRFSNSSNSFVTSSQDSSFWAMEGTANTYGSEYGSNQNHMFWWAHSSSIGRMHLYGDLTDVYPSTVTHLQQHVDINASSSPYSFGSNSDGTYTYAYSSDGVNNLSTVRFSLGTLSNTGSHFFHSDGSGSTEKHYEWWVGNQ